MLHIPDTITYVASSMVSQSKASHLPTAVLVTKHTKKTDKTAHRQHLNKPLPGFHIYNNADGSGRKGVIDPRGFVTYITNTNLTELMDTCCLSRGLIQEMCVWVNSTTTSRMELVSLDSPKYIKAMDNTTMLDTALTMDQVDIGDTVHSQYGVTGVYLGRMNLYGSVGSGSVTNQCKPQRFLNKHVMRISNGTYFYRTDLKLIAIKAKALVPITTEQALSDINADIENNSTYFTERAYFGTSYYSFYGRVKMVSSVRTTAPKMRLRQVTYDQAISMVRHGDLGNVMVVDHSGIWYTTRGYHSVTTCVPDVDMCRLVFNEPPTGGSFTDFIETSRDTTHWRQPVTSALSGFAKWYAIEKHVGNEIYI